MFCIKLPNKVVVYGVGKSLVRIVRKICKQNYDIFAGAALKPLPVPPVVTLVTYPKKKSGRKYCGYNMFNKFGADPPKYFPNSAVLGIIYLTEQT